MLWWRAHLRRRWRAAIALAVFVGLAASVPTATLTGARRADTAFERARDINREPDGTIERGGPVSAGGVPEEALARAQALPLLESTAIFDLLLMRPVDSDFFFAFEFLVISPRDATLGTEMGRFEILDGRERDMDADDEVLLDHRAATELGIAAGDTLRLESWTNETRDGFFMGAFDGLPPRDGPVVAVTVVGTIENPISNVDEGAPPVVITTPAFHARHVGPDPDTGSIGNFPGIMFFRLADGVDPDELEPAVRAIEADYDGAFSIEFTGEGVDEVNETKDAQVVALLLFTGIGGLAGILIVGLALTRSILASRASDGILRALGASRRQRVANAVMSVAPVIFLGSVIGGAVAWLASSLFPVGLAGAAEPTPGRELHLAIAPITLGAFALTMLVWAALVGSFVARGRRREAPDKPARIPALLRRLGLPIAATTGVHLALDRSRGTRAVPTRPALIGAVAGLAGVIGALAFNASLDHVTRSPDLYGWEADAVVAIGDDRDAYLDVRRSFEQDPRVERVSASFPATFRGGQGAPHEFIDARAIDPAAGPPLHTVIDGRAPQASDEVALGPVLADSWGVGIGDQIALVDGTGAQRRFDVVGITLVPEVDFVPYRNVATVTWEAADALENDDAGEPQLFLLVDYEAAAAAGAIEELRANDTIVFEQTAPAPIVALRELRGFPIAMAGFLALLAGGFLIHALIQAVNQRRRDMAVLKAMGSRRRQVAGAIVWQGVTVALIGVLLGVPLGLAAGRLAYAGLAGAIDVPVVVRTPAMIFIAGAGALALAVLTSAWPAARAARTKVATVLRAE